jgi:hypothetical protein
MLQSAATGKYDTLDLDSLARTIIALTDGFNLQDPVS